MKKIILHLCADLGSDSWYYQQDEDYEVIKVGVDIGVENFVPPKNVHGIIANPVCTEFSTARGFDKKIDKPDLTILNHCLRIIKESNPKWWIIENPFNGTMKDILGIPQQTYQPWQYGSPWTKKTALWGRFNIPKRLFNKWEEVKKNDKLYIRPGRKKPGMVYFHKSAIDLIPEFYKFKEYVKNDADFRSLCSQGFAREFYNANN